MADRDLLPARVSESPGAASRLLETAVVLGIVHALVDASTVAVLYVELPLGRIPFDEVYLLVALYNGLAFGLQVPLGLLCDRLRADWPMALAGLAVTLLAVGVSLQAPHAGIVLGGLGNALFHVGAGAMVLRRSGDRAAAPGLFVAPGAFGLMLGVWLGLSGLPGRALLALALVAAMVLLAVYRPAVACSLSQAGEGRGVRASALAIGFCVLLLFLSIAARSVLGDVLAAPWRGAPLVMLAITLAAVAAKALSGFAADRIGWRVVAVSALLLLAPLSAASLARPAAAVGEMLLLQAAMPVTLAALRIAFPRHPGTAFGLASAALLLGAAPGFFQVSSWLDPSPLLALAILLSAGLLYLGLAIAPRPRIE